MDKPDIYLDVSGVILLPGNKLANHAEEFIEFLVENFDVYWLTSLAKDGDANNVIDIIDGLSRYDISEYLEDIEPTSWSTNKTEAIDLESNFLWFDDYCSEEDKKILKENNAYENWTEVDLSIDPDQLEIEIDELKRYL